MKAHGLRLVAVVLVASALLLAGRGHSFASDGEPAGGTGPGIGFDLNNWTPTNLDTIEMTISVMLPAGCFDVQAGEAVVAVNTVTVTIEANQADLCSAMIGDNDLALHRTFGPLSIGTFDVSAQVDVNYTCQVFCESDSISQGTNLEVYAVGDASCDRQVNSIDANIVLQQPAFLIATAPCESPADANRDGEVLATDATLILQYDARLLDRLPPGYRP